MKPHYTPPLITNRLSEPSFEKFTLFNGTAFGRLWLDNLSSEEINDRLSKITNTHYLPTTRDSRLAAVKHVCATAAECSTESSSGSVNEFEDRRLDVVRSSNKTRVDLSAFGNSFRYEPIEHSPGITFQQENDQQNNPTALHSRQIVGRHSKNKVGARINQHFGHAPHCMENTRE